MARTNCRPSGHRTCADPRAIVLVADGTRRATLETAVELQREAEACLGRVPFVLALNKHDLSPDWDLPADALERLAREGWTVFLTSARTGEGVNEALGALARLMIPLEPRVEHPSEPA